MRFIRSHKSQRTSTTNLVSFDNYYNGFNKENELQESHRLQLPNLANILLIIVICIVFILLPIVYLINCFEFKFDDQKFYYHNSVCQNIDVSNRFDCYPGKGATKDKCEARGCCWSSNSDLTGVPYCFYPLNHSTYTIVNVTETSYGLIAFMQRKYDSGYPGDVDVLKMVVKYESDTRLRIKIVDPINVRYETPYPEVPVIDKGVIDAKYVFEIDTVGSGFKILRKSDYTVLFDSNNFQDLIYSDQFLQISSSLPSKYIYGIGERRSSLLLNTNWTKYTLFNHDEIPTDKKNLYGSHPFYLVMEPSAKSHGVFLLNSNAMEITLQPKPSITFRTIGGIIDLYFFMGPEPKDVISQYTELIGRPFMPPYWSLGFHLCRFGYKTLNDTKKVMQRNIDAGIPIDTQWNDLDYMNNSNDFTYDHTNYAGLPDFVRELHSNGMHYIPLVDPGVSASEPRGSYPPFDIGVKMDIFVKNSTGDLFIGKVWNKKSTVWPDFTNPLTVDYWTLMLKTMHKEIEIDGAWIDMNEPSNFLSGSFDGCPDSNLEKPPYELDVDGGILNYKTMCMTAKQYAGTHYDVHNLYGFTESIVTNFALSEIRRKRPMVISRSTFPGSGKYAGHWSGDVWSSWDDMKYTIPELLSFSLFGIPLMGADICGFNGNSTAALCNRWVQLGAFYPFSRNHNTDDGVEQDPVAMGDQVVKSSVNALNIRYALLPYLYTLFYRAHVYGETVARPLFFEFPQDTNTYQIDNEFLWGSSLLIIPVLEENALEVSNYIPKGLWYNYHTYASFYSNGNTISLQANLDTIPLFVRGGNILPLQLPKSTTTESRKSSFRLLIASDDSGYASGELYWDDGDSLNSYIENNYCLISFELNYNTLRSSTEFNGNLVLPHLDVIIVLGVEQKPITVTLNGKNVPDVKFNKTTKTFEALGLDVPINENFVFAWK